MKLTPFTEAMCWKYVLISGGYGLAFISLAEPPTWAMLAIVVLAVVGIVLLPLVVGNVSIWSDARGTPVVMSEPTRREVLEMSLTQGVVSIGLDPTVAGVVVPAHLAKQTGLVLELGRYGLAVPIPDLEIDDEGITATLSFGRQPFHCTIPWEAVGMITAHWPTAEDASEEDTQPRIRVPYLRAVK